MGRKPGGATEIIPNIDVN